MSAKHTTDFFESLTHVHRTGYSRMYDVMMSAKHKTVFFESLTHVHRTGSWYPSTQPNFMQPEETINIYGGNGKRNEVWVVSMAMLYYYGITW